MKNAPVQFQVIEASQKAIVADGVRYTDAESKYDASKLDAQKLFSFPWKGTIQVKNDQTLCKVVRFDILRYVANMVRR